MILTRDQHHGDYEIRAYERGQLKINDQLYTQSVIIGSGCLKMWTPQTFDELTVEHFEIIFEFNPEVVLLGTGEQLIFPSAKLLKRFYEEQIGIEVMKTLSACHTFNVLMSEERNAIAALLIR